MNIANNIFLQKPGKSWWEGPCASLKDMYSFVHVGTNPEIQPFAYRSFLTAGELNKGRARSV